MMHLDDSNNDSAYHENELKISDYPTNDTDEDGENLEEEENKEDPAG
jgi:hypothetical protein